MAIFNSYVSLPESINLIPSYSWYLYVFLNVIFFCDINLSHIPTLTWLVSPSKNLRRPRQQRTSLECLGLLPGHWQRLVLQRPDGNERCGCGGANPLRSPGQKRVWKRPKGGFGWDLMGSVFG